jgi:hypothetical protein
MQEAIGLKGLLGEYGKVQDMINLFCDSQTITHLANNLTYHSKIKQMYHFVR